MEEHELKHIWHSSSKNEEISINTAQLMSDFKSKMERREHIVRRRDLKETIGAAIGTLLFGYILIELPFSISKIGAFLMIISMIHFVFKLYINRKSKFTHNLFLPIKEQLLKQREFMLRQANLLGNVHLLFLPVFVSYLLFAWGSTSINHVENSIVEFILVKKLHAKIIGTLFMLIYGIYIIRLNKRAVKVNWEPLIKDIDTIIENLDKDK